MWPQVHEVKSRAVVKLREVMSSSSGVGAAAAAAAVVGTHGGGAAAAQFVPGPGPAGWAAPGAPPAAGSLI